MRREDVFDWTALVILLAVGGVLLFLTTALVTGILVGLWLALS